MMTLTSSTHCCYTTAVTKDEESVVWQTMIREFCTLQLGCADTLWHTRVVVVPRNTCRCKQKIKMRQDEHLRVMYSLKIYSVSSRDPPPTSTYIPWAPVQSGRPWGIIAFISSKYGSISASIARTCPTLQFSSPMKVTIRGSLFIWTIWKGFGGHFSMANCFCNSRKTHYSRLPGSWSTRW